MYFSSTAVFTSRAAEVSFFCHFIDESLAFCSCVIISSRFSDSLVDHTLSFIHGYPAAATILNLKLFIIFFHCRPGRIDITVFQLGSPSSNTEDAYSWQPSSLSSDEDAAVPIVITMASYCKACGQVCWSVNVTVRCFDERSNLFRR